MEGLISTDCVVRWTTTEIENWLKTLGMKKYFTKFKRNMISGEVLVQLDDILLDDLKVTDTKDREILLKAVEKFTSVNQPSSFLMTSFSEEKECINPKSEPEMEVVENGVVKLKEDFISSPSFAKLLPTIGEEEESPKGSERLLINESKAVLMKYEGENDEHEHHHTTHEALPLEASNTEKKKELTLGMVDDTDKETYQSNAISDCHEVASRATEIVQVFSEENMCLRKKLEKCYQEIKHLKSVEKELRESQIMYRDLKSAFIIREHKEKAMRSRMEAEIVQLRITNTELNDELKKLKALKSEIEVHDHRNQINQKDDQLKQLHKEKKFYKSSLTNLEKMLKQKSSEILMLQKQLKASCMKNISTSLTKENNNGENGENKISNDFSEQFHDSMLTSSLGRTATKFEDRFHQRKNDRNAPMNSNVSVLIELLKEKDAQIIKFREEINEWDILQKRRHSKRRYSDLETEIRTLHVKLAEKDAQIKILECKYGENYADCKQLSTPFRIPSFEIHSSLSSYQDSGIITVSDSHGYKEIQETHNSKDEGSSEEPLRHRNSDYDLAQRNEHEKTILSEYCWFV